jgi:hypothetical protein
MAAATDEQSDEADWQHKHHKDLVKLDVSHKGR